MFKACTQRLFNFNTSLDLPYFILKKLCFAVALKRARKTLYMSINLIFPKSKKLLHVWNVYHSFRVKCIVYRKVFYLSIFIIPPYVLYLYWMWPWFIATMLPTLLIKFHVAFAEKVLMSFWYRFFWTNVFIFISDLSECSFISVYR